MSEEVKAPEVTQATPEVVEAPAAQETTPTQASATFKAFATEEEFNNFVKSTSSKAKNEILKALEANSVDEGRQKMSQAEQLEEQLQATVKRLNQLEEENALVKVGVLDEFRDEALTLARSKTNNEINLEEALRQVAGKFPNLLVQQPKTEKIQKIGAEKGVPKETDSAEELKQRAAAKFGINWDK